VQKDEKVIVVAQKHWWALVTYLILPVLALILTSLIVAGMVAMNLMASIGGIVVAAILILGPLLWAVWQFFDWGNDYYIVTNRRIVHQERVILFFEERHEAYLSRIQDVTFRSRGILAQLLRFGDLVMRTAAAQGEIVFKSLPNPQALQAVILQQVSLVQRRERTSVREMIRSELLKQINPPYTPPVTPPPPPAPLHPRKEGILGRLFRGSRSAARNVSLTGGEIVWRKSRFVLLYETGHLILAMLVLWPLTAYVALSGMIPLLPLLAAATILFLVLAGYFLWLFVDWHNDLYIVSDTRIIDIGMTPLGLEVERREASLNQIQDVRYRIPHPIAAILNIGNVLIETAGPGGTFTFDRVAKPEEVQRVILERMEAFRQRQREQEGEARVREVVDALAVYHELSNPRPSPPPSA
jgi:hypothetical protein